MRRLQMAAASAIIFAWIGALGFGMASDDYQGVDVATPVVLVALGFIFGDAFLQRLSKDRPSHD